MAKASVSSSKVMQKKKASSTPKRPPHAYNLFVAEMMPILCKIERTECPVSMRRRPCELMSDIGSLWQSHKIGNYNISPKNFNLLTKISVYASSV
jgi:hypothetical protein